MPVRFGDREVDLELVAISGPDGPIAVQPQVFSLIEHLITHRDRVVPHDELLDEVWGTRHVSPTAVTSAVKLARRALGDDGSRQHVIRTVQGRGYHFVADLAPDPATDRDPVRDTVRDTDSDASQPAVPDTVERRTGDAVDDRADDRAPTDRWPTGPGDETWPFVGRFAELDAAMGALTADGIHGIAIEGDDRMGATWFARAVAVRAAAADRTVVRVHPTAPEVPLSALADLLPNDVYRVATADSGLARAQLFRQALEAVERHVAGRPTVIAVDGADRLDGMSEAVLTRLVSEGAIFAIVAQRGPTSPAFGELVTAGAIRKVSLGPLDEADVDVLLFRYLAGPIDRTSLRRLWEVSGGSPGVLRDVVDSSIGTDALQRVDGVWRLVGQPVSRAAVDWPDPTLATEAIEAAERLAVMRSIPIDDGERLIGDAILDDLDRAGLIAITSRFDRATLELADELLAATIEGAMPPIRRHRIRTDLVSALGESADPAVLATIVRWGDDFVERIEPARRYGAAVGAMLSGDAATAELLVDTLDLGDWPVAAVVKAELDVQHGRHGHAEELLDALDLDVLDDLSRSFALRRRASIEFDVRQRHDEALDHLARDAEQYDGDVAGSLLARRLALLGYVGRYREVLEGAAALCGLDGEIDADSLLSSDLTGLIRLEAVLACASAFGSLGRFSDAIRAAEDAASVLQQLPPAWQVEGADHAVSIRISNLQQIGQPTTAAASIRDHLDIGRISQYGFLPPVAADLELAQGRARSAREIVRSAVSSVSVHAHPLYAPVNAAVAARCELSTGGTDVDPMAVVAEVAGASPGIRRWTMRHLGDLIVEHGGESRLIEAVEASADDARAARADLGEMELRCALVAIDQTPDTARRMVDRIDEIAGRFDGDLWPIRIDHVRARAEHLPLDDIAARYRELGFELFARRADRGL